MKFKEVLEDKRQSSEVLKNKIAIEKGENWGLDESGKRSYDLFWGPCDEDKCVSDNVFLKREWMSQILHNVGITDYELWAAENYHVLYIENDEIAKEKFKEICKLIKEEGFKVVRDCY